jgi:hypothetical protein
MPDLPGSPFVMGNDVIDRHCKRFYELFNNYLKGKDYTTQPMSEEGYDERMAFLKALDSGIKTLPELRKIYPQAYHWNKQFEIVSFGTSEKLVFKAEETVPLDQRQQVLHRGNFFQAIYAVHAGTEGNGCAGHRMARTLHKACTAKYGKSAPSWATDMLCKTCPVCISKNTRKKPKAGHTPIITRGFQARGQIDLIDMQSTPDGEFKYILSYRCHGTKFCLLEALQTKTKRSVAWVLFNIFTMLGPPAILQADNGREFNGAACGGNAKQIEMDEDVRACVYKCVL